MDGIGDGILGLLLFGVFAAVIMLALAIAFALSWFGLKTPSLWVIGAGVILAWAAVKYVRRHC